MCNLSYIKSVSTNFVDHETDSSFLLSFSCPFKPVQWASRGWLLNFPGLLRLWDIFSGHLQAWKQSHFSNESIRSSIYHHPLMQLKISLLCQLRFCFMLGSLQWGRDIHSPSFLSFLSLFSPSLVFLSLPRVEAGLDRVWSVPSRVAQYGWLLLEELSWGHHKIPLQHPLPGPGPQTTYLSPPSLSPWSGGPSFPWATSYFNQSS